MIKYGGRRRNLLMWLKLKIGKIRNILEEGRYSTIYGTGGIMGYVDTYSYDNPPVLIQRKGTITNIFHLDEPFWNG